MKHKSCVADEAVGGAKFGATVCTYVQQAVWFEPAVFGVVIFRVG